MMWESHHYQLLFPNVVDTSRALTHTAGDCKTIAPLFLWTLWIPHRWASFVQLLVLSLTRSSNFFLSGISIGTLPERSETAEKGITASPPPQPCFQSIPASMSASTLRTSAAGRAPPPFSILSILHSVVLSFRIPGSGIQLLPFPEFLFSASFHFWVKIISNLRVSRLLFVPYLTTIISIYLQLFLLLLFFMSYCFNSLFVSILDYTSSFFPQFE